MLSDESLVPTRGGDWDDNGVWRVIHAHTWNADHAQILSVFNNFNKVNFDATNVLGFNPTSKSGCASKIFKSFCFILFVGFIWQYPVRNPGDNLLLAPTVRSGAEAIDSIINDITAALPNLPAAGDPTIINIGCSKSFINEMLPPKGSLCK